MRDLAALEDALIGAACEGNAAIHVARTTGQVAELAASVGGEYDG